MKHEFQIFLFSVLLGGLILTFSGCTTSKQTAEEAGYLEQISTVLTPASMIGNLRSAQRFDGTLYFVTIEAMQKQDWAKLKNDLSSTIPPNSLKTLHEKVVRIIETQQAFEALNPTNYSDNGFLVKNTLIPDSEEIKSKLADLKSLSDQLRLLQREFNDHVEQRQPQNVNGDSVNLVYRPPMVPLDFSYSANEGFDIDFTPSIETPVGTFSAGIKEAKGITKLAIRSEGKTRYFKLDRAFRLFIPTDYGVEVIGTGTDQLIIEVKKKV